MRGNQSCNITPTITPEQLPESINFQLEYLPEFQKLWGYSRGLTRCLCYQAILEAGWAKAKLLLPYDTLYKVKHDLINAGYIHEGITIARR